MANARGANLSMFMRCFARIEGEAAAASMIAALPDDLRALLAPGSLDPLGWYPIEHNVTLHRVAQTTAGRGRELSYAIGRLSVQEHFRGALGGLFGELSPSTLVEHATRAFHAFFDTGRIEAADRQADAVLLRWMGCVGFDANLWADVLGGCEGCLVVAGVAAPSVQRVDGGGDGERFMTARLAWTAPPDRGLIS